MNTTTHALTEDYLRRLDQSARVLPRRDREELIAEIRDHLAAGLRPDASETDVRMVLDGLGSPEDIVAAARPERSPTRRGARETFALVLLVSGFPPIIGWLAGVGLLLSSPLWNWRQKMLGILVWPGGYLLVLLLLGGAISTHGSVTACTERPVAVPLTGPAPATPSDSSFLCTGPSGSPLWGQVLFAVMVLAPLVVAGYLYRAAGRQAEAV